MVEKLGFEPVLLPFHPNGKPQHVKGFLREFAQTASSTAEFLNQVAQLEIPMVGVDASLLLVYRDEYVKTLGEGRGDFAVLAVHEWLQRYAAGALETQQAKSTETYALLTHCTEKTALPTSEKQWQAIYNGVGLSLDIVSVGCCGMAGTYGHELHHYDNAKGIFELSWSAALAKYEPQQWAVTGYSCRSQVKRLTENYAKHPLQILLQAL